METNTEGKTAPDAPAPAVNCPSCRRLFGIGSNATQGSVLTCPFCGASMRLALRTILVAEPLEAA